MLRRTHKTVEWHFKRLGRKFVLISSELYGKSESFGRPETECMGEIVFQGIPYSFEIFQMNLDWLTSYYLFYLPVQLLSYTKGSEEYVEHFFRVNFATGRDGAQLIG